MAKRNWPWSRKDPRPEILERVRPHLIERFADLGVTGIVFIEVFPHLDNCSVWLCTDTDEQRDRLGTENPMLEEIHQVLGDAGFTAEQLTHVQSTAESQESVDRYYNGNWYQAMK